jgi:diguanylate cyclase (GGDEF)-like protein
VRDACGDLAARYGGEEFALVLPDTDRIGALHQAEQVRKHVIELGIPHHGSEIGGLVNISAGVSAMTPTGNNKAAELIQQADVALYGAKEAGRNRCLG